MPSRRRAVEIGATRGRDAVRLVGLELEAAMRGHGLSYAAVGRDVGLSGVQVARVAHGQAPGLTLVQAAELLAAVGQDLSVRAYPTGRPLRDAAHLALLDRLRTALHPTLRWLTEVPIGRAGDLRAWDAMIVGADWRVPVEAETRLSDIQSLQRRITLKSRDGEVEHAILLVAGTRSNRALIRSLGTMLDEQFPLDGRRALELLRAGVNPGAGSLILL